MDERQKDYAGPWFPPLDAAPVQAPPVANSVEEPIIVAPPAWLNDPEVEPEVLAPVRVKSERRWLMPGAASVVIVVGVIVGGFMAFSSGAGSTNTALAAPALGSVASLNSQDWCPESSSNGRTIGSGKGDLKTGPGLIMWLEHAYYVERDPAAVQAAFAKGATGIDPEGVRKSIEALKPGVKHCVEIVEQAPQRFHVRVDELRADGSNVTWGEVFIISIVGGRPMISAVHSDDDAK